MDEVQELHCCANGSRDKMNESFYASYRILSIIKTLVMTLTLTHLHHRNPHDHSLHQLNLVEL